MLGLYLILFNKGGPREPYTNVTDHKGHNSVFPRRQTNYYFDAYSPKSYIFYAILSYTGITFCSGGKWTIIIEIHDKDSHAW